MFKNKFNIDKTRIKGMIVAFSPMLIIVAAFLFVAYRYIDPAPPKHVLITAGDPEGNYFAAAMKYKEIMKGEGIDLEVLPSKGAWDNLKRLEDPSSGVEIGFVQDGLGSRAKQPDISSLGSLFYEPVWIFYRGQKELTRLTQLTGFRIAIGEHGGETHTMAKNLLTAATVTDKNSKWLELPAEEGAKALLAGQADAAFFIASASEKLIQDLLKDPSIKVMSMDQAEALTRQFPYLHHLTLPHGTLDLAKNIPSHDIELVAPTATLVARNSLHPAIVYLFLKATSKVHHQPGIFEKKSEFPYDKDFVFPINSGAKEYFKSGAPFWLRYLPFWLATLMERFIFLVLPTAAIVIPLLKLIPRYLNWRIRSRMFELYGELKMLEDQIRNDAKSEQIEKYVGRLDVIEDRIHQMNFPIDVFDDVYVLREHIHFVRERLSRMANNGTKKLFASI
jgi:TRAP-type uncharacterized transport system substrate-binding protein